MRAPYIPHFNRNAFIETPDYKPMEDGVRWDLTKKMVYVDPWGKTIETPAGFTTDFASIPDLSRIALYVQILSLVLAHFAWPLWILFCAASWVIYIAESFLHEGTWDDQSALHDWMYATRCRTFTQANWILFEAMKAKGVAQTPEWKRWIIFIGVSLGGYVAWLNDARKIENRKTEKFIKQAQAKNKSTTTKK